MIRSFKHKGLEKYFFYGDRKGISSKHAPRLGRILDRLDASIEPQDMNLLGFKLHELKGKEKGTWSFGSVVIGGLRLNSKAMTQYSLIIWITTSLKGGI